MKRRPTNYIIYSVFTGEVVRKVKSKGRARQIENELDILSGLREFTHRAVFR